MIIRNSVTVHINGIKRITVTVQIGIFISRRHVIIIIIVIEKIRDTVIVPIQNGINQIAAIHGIFQIVHQTVASDIAFENTVRLNIGTNGYIQTTGFSGISQAVAIAVHIEVIGDAVAVQIECRLYNTVIIAYCIIIIVIV